MSTCVVFSHKSEMSESARPKIAEKVLFIHRVNISGNKRYVRDSQ